MAGLIEGGFNIWADEEAKEGQKNARSAMEQALDALKTINIGDVVNLSDERDIARYKKGFELQKEVDPATAALRQKGAESLLEGIKDDPKVDSILSALADEGLKDSPLRAKLIDKLFEGAQAELDAGATLPPEFQAEVMRAGLEQSGKAGVGADYRGAAGVTNRQLLGTAGINLQAQRRQQATQMLSAADALKQNRAAILSNSAAGLESAQAQRQARQLNAFTAGNNAIPGLSIGGGDVANLSIANTNLENQRSLMRGGMRAQDALAMSALAQDEIKQGGKMLSSVVSLVAGGMGGGMMGGMGGGVGGGMGGMLGGLMGGGGGGTGGAQYIQSAGFQLPYNYYGLTPGQQGQYVGMIKNANRINSSVPSGWFE